jgi:hypothetical protein
LLQVSLQIIFFIFEKKQLFASMTPQTTEGAFASGSPANQKESKITTSFLFLPILWNFFKEI